MILPGGGKSFAMAASLLSARTQAAGFPFPGRPTEHV
jgi:hypothetical protein